MDVYLNSGMVLLDSGLVATSVDCCCGALCSCGDCDCAFSSPYFNPDDGLCYTHFENVCGVITYSGTVVDCGALFALETLNSSCCAPCSGSISAMNISFCNCVIPDFPFCDATCTGDGCTTPLVCDGCLRTNILEVSHQADPPCG